MWRLRKILIAALEQVPAQPAEYLPHRCNLDGASLGVDAKGFGIEAAVFSQDAQRFIDRSTIVRRAHRGGGLGEVTPLGRLVA